MVKGQLIVEGKEKHIIWALCEKHKVEQTFEVKDLKGINNVLKGIPNRLKSGNFVNFGVIFDADDNLESRWDSLKNKFEEFGYSLPKQPQKEGVIVAHPEEDTFYPLKIGVWIMPNNQDSGKVENFMEALVSEGNVLYAMARKAVLKVEKEIKQNQRFDPKDRPKALIHTYLAWKKDPPTQMGLAITKKYFDADAELAKTFVGWLNKLFNS